MIVTKERWRDLCKQAAVERDPEKLVQLCDEINAILQKASRENDQISEKNSLAVGGGQD
jgi:hypothetical protein